MTAATADTWTLADIPDQAGRTILVTGTTRGRARPPHRARAGPPGRPGGPRGPHRGRLDETAATIRAEVPAAALEQLRRRPLRPGVGTPRGRGRRGVRPDRRAGQQRRRDGHARYQRTADGLDLQLATNHFGPFLLTGLLLPAAGRERGRDRGDGVLEHAPDRPVGAARRPDRAAAAGTGSGAPTAQSKLANLLFTYELDRRRCGEAGCRSRRWPRTPASPAPTSPPTASTAGPPAASPRSSTPRSRRCPSPPPRAPGRP